MRYTIFNVEIETGEDIAIGHLCNFTRPELVKLGNHVAIDSFLHCTTQLTVKDWVHIGPHVSIIGGKDTYCEIGNFSGMAAGCRIICASDEYLGEGIINPMIRKEYRDNVKSAPIILEDFVTLATNVIVLPGVTLAEGTVVAAGGVVTKSTKPWMIYAGSPARPIQQRPKEKMIAYAKEMGYGTKTNS